MTRVIEQHRNELAALCQRFKVRRLELFGSGATDRFDPRRSDLDFLVEFQRLRAGERGSSYFGLLAALRSLLGRPVDLVEPEAVSNPYFMKGIQQSRMLLYEAPIEEAPV